LRGSKIDTRLAIDAQHRLLHEGFPVVASDFFDTLAAVFVASWVKQYDSPRVEW
jgi:hypothetical protein